MIRISAFTMLGTGVLLAIWFLVFGNYFAGQFSSPDTEKIKELHPFFTGLVVPLVTLGSTLLVLENLRNTSRQNFSNNFFKLIDQHHKLVDNINTQIDGIVEAGNPCPSKGRTFFDDLAHRIATDYKYLPVTPGLEIESETKPNEEIDVTGVSGKEKLLRIYDHYFHLHQSDIGHYFRNLYRIVRYTEKANFTNKFKVDHIKMLRAQLSNYEILILAYNGLHHYGAKFHRLIEKYELLNNLNTEERVPKGWEKRIIDIEVLKTAYPKWKAHLEKVNA